MQKQCPEQCRDTQSLGLDFGWMLAFSCLVWMSRSWTLQWDQDDRDSHRHSNENQHWNMNLHRLTLEQFLKTHHQAMIRLAPPRCSHCIICIHFLLFNQLVTTIGKLRTRLLVSVPSGHLNCPWSSGWDDWDVFVYHVSTLCEANASYCWAWGGILSSDPSLAQNSRGCCIGDCTADCEEIDSEQNSDHGTAS